MSSTVRITYAGPHDEVHVPEHGIVAVRGGVVEVGASIAGRGPGAWGPLPEGASLVDDGRQYRRAADGSWEARDPGTGLLAQEDVWQAVSAAPAPARGGKSAAQTSTQEG